MLIIELVGGALLGMSAIGLILLGTLDKALQNWRAEGNRKRDAEDRKNPIVPPILELKPDSLANGHTGGPDHEAYPMLQAARAAAEYAREHAAADVS